MIDDTKTLMHVRERLYDRRQTLLSDIEVLDQERKQHAQYEDMQEYIIVIDTMKDEVEFLEKLINDLENAYFV